MNAFLSLDLTNNQPRRFGIARPFKSPMINKSGTNAPANPPDITMPTKNASKVPAARAPPKSTNRKTSGKESGSEEDFERPPDSSDDDDTSDPYPITSTVFETKASAKQSTPPKLKETGAGRAKRSVGTTESKGHNISPSSSASSSIQKRKTQDNVDVFGNIPLKKSKVAKYGSSQKSYGSKASSQGSKNSPVKGWKRPVDLPSSSGQQSNVGSPLKSKFNPGEDLPAKSPKKHDKFKYVSDDEDSAIEPKSSLASRSRHVVKDEAPATQPPQFKFYDDLDLSALDPLEPLPAAIIETLEETNDVEANDVVQDLDTASKDEEFPIEAKVHRCPMCNEQVDVDDLKAYGHMNTRAQEKFCRMHRKRAATKEWSAKGYPEIKWERLDARVKAHHAFIRKLINGADSHYRDILQDKVNKGKDRNFRKMTSNLTPGYYGSRGLRVISENIMAKFTPLLKKQMIQDPLMSARGFTPFVQAVIVPEVTVLLIKEDMDVDVEKAREILSDSAALGELLNEELREVVAHVINDSDEDDFDD